MKTWFTDGQMTVEYFAVWVIILPSNIVNKKDGKVWLVAK